MIIRFRFNGNINSLLYSFQASAYVAQVYDSVLAYAHALTSLHEAGTINKVRMMFDADT